MSWIQVTSDVTLSNITLSNNLLMNIYFENFIVGLHVLYVLNICQISYQSSVIYHLIHKLIFYTLF